MQGLSCCPPRKQGQNPSGKCPSVQVPLLAGEEAEVATPVVDEVVDAQIAVATVPEEHQHAATAAEHGHLLAEDDDRELTLQLTVLCAKRQTVRDGGALEPMLAHVRERVLAAGAAVEVHQHQLALLTVGLLDRPVVRLLVLDQIARPVVVTRVAQHLETLHGVVGHGAVHDRTVNL